VGDFLRIGSVGLVVSEMHTGEGQSMVLSEGDLAYLREDVGEIWDDFFATDEAATAADEAVGKASPRWVSKAVGGPCVPCSVALHLCPRCWPRQVGRVGG
jgi:hypothetical protein